MSIQRWWNRCEKEWNEAQPLELAAGPVLRWSLGTFPDCRLTMDCEPEQGKPYQPAKPRWASFVWKSNQEAMVETSPALADTRLAGNLHHLAHQYSPAASPLKWALSVACVLDLESESEDLLSHYSD